MFRRTLPNLPLLGVLLLALALRVWGLGWGLPSATHYFSYHPDESMILSHAMGMNLLGGDWLPHFYNYGTLQLYLVNAANTLVFLFGNGTLVKDYAAQHAAWAQQYLVGRWLTVAMGVGTVVATAALGTRLWGRRAGVLAALILAIMPLHVQHSHWLTVDVPATFWGTLSLFWSARLAMGEDARPLRAALGAGLFAGLAAATKYNLALALLPLGLAALFPFPGPHWRTRRGERTGRLRPGLGLAVGLLAALLAFLIACPGVVLDAARFRHDLGYEAYHVQHLAGAEFTDTGSGFAYQIRRNLDAGLGLPLLVLCLGSVGYALARRERGDGLLAAFALPYYVLIGLAVVRYARYTIPLLPVLALWTGRLLADVSRLPHPTRRRGGVVAGAAILLFTLVDTLLLIRPMTAMDNRDRAWAWLQGHAPDPVPIGFAALPWFGVPPVSPWFCAFVPGTWTRIAASRDDLRRIVYPYQVAPDGSILRHDWDVATLRRVSPEFVVLSEDDYDDALRLHDPVAIAYLQTLRRHYALVPFDETDDNRDVQGLHDDAYGLPTRDLPSDMLYTNPVILIYKRR